MPSLLTLMNAAQSSHQRGDFAGAARGYEAVLKQDPRNYDVAYLLAVALYQGGRLERAASAFAAAARLNPKRFEPHKDRGLILMRLGQNAEAAASFSRALALKPDAPDLLVNRGIALKNAGQVVEAVASYRKALRLNAGFAEAHNNLGNALALLGHSQEALTAYREALRLKPLYGEAQLNAARLLMDDERFEEARAMLDGLLAREPRHAEATAMLAQCLAATGHDADALAAAAEAVKLDGGTAQSFLARAEVLSAARREQDALADYARALALEPRNVTALLGKAELLSKLARYDEAIALCDTAISAQPGNARAYFHIGRALHGKAELLAALRSYEKAAELDAEWLSPRLRAAGVLNALGRHEQALAACDAILARSPDSAAAHMGRGDSLRELGRLPEALASYEEAIARAPERASYWGLRGSLHGEMGDKDAALADFSKSLRLTASGDAQAEQVAADCTRLLSVDKIPAIYASEEELDATRGEVEAVLDSLLECYRAAPAPGPAALRVAEQAMHHLTGFYLAYHQRNDRPTMEKLSQVATRLLAPGPYEPPPRRAGPIRIGIASQRLRDHNGANWAYNWFARLPRGDYEFFTYPLESRSDELGAKFAALGTHRPLTWSRRNPREIVEQMRADRLDYLMLTDVGMSAVSRFLSLHRIAPRQFTAWGHPVTTGSPQMDFYLSSDLMEPPDAQDHYSEKLVRMPNLALYLEEREAGEDPGETKADAASFGLPEGRVLYGCLQSLFKYLPRHDAILPRIAAAVPDALFVFIEGSPAYMTAVIGRRLEAAFAAQGLDWTRHVTFVPRQSHSAFDRLMRAMDVCIDSIGWSGGNTTIKNIRYGVPLATLEGQFMRGRHSSAMFRMIGAEEMIASSVEDYVNLLVKLGREKGFRHHCAETFRRQGAGLYRDEGFIAAFDTFLKANVPA